MKKISLFLAAVVLTGVACSGDDALADMELRVVSGSVSLIRDGEPVPFEDRVDLEAGDVIVSKNDALAKFALEGGADAREGQIQGDSRILVSSTTAIEAEEGRVLMDVSEPTRVRVDDVTVASSEGSFRIDRGFGSVRAGTYAGSAELDAPGQTGLKLPALYQATIVAGDLPREIRPYQLDEKDPWDQVVLEDVVALEQELEVLAQGLGRQLGRQRPDLAYFRFLADGDPVDFISRYLRRQPSDLLIGFTIARNADYSLGRAFTRAFGLFDDGARWGVAAAIMEVEPRPIVAQLERLILGTGVVASSGGSKAQFTLAAAAASEPGSTVAPPTSGSNTTQPQPPPDTGQPTEPNDPQDPQDPEDPKEEPDECTNTQECAQEDIEDLVPDPNPSPSPTQDQKTSDSGLLEGGLPD